MKTTIYELLGMIKDGKAPKKIRYSSYVFKYTGDKRISRMYVMENQETYLFRDMVVTLTNEVEILETTITYKPDKIEKLKATLNCIKDSETILGGEYYVIHSDFIIALEEELDKINELIDRVNKL